MFRPDGDGQTRSPHHQIHQRRSVSKDRKSWVLQVTIGGFAVNLVILQFWILDLDFGFVLAPTNSGRRDRTLTSCKLSRHQLCIAAEA